MHDFQLTQFDGHSADFQAIHQLNDHQIESTEDQLSQSGPIPLNLDCIGCAGLINPKRQISFVLGKNH